MALEAVVFQKDPNFDYGCKDYFNYNIGCYDDFGLIQSFQEDQKPCILAADLNSSINGEQISSYNSAWEYSSPSSLVAGNNHTTAASSLENPAASPSATGDVFFSSGKSRRKRRRVKTEKNRAEMENQRMTHIAVERNRRRQMNDYLSVLRSLMPPSYSQRGDQASIVGGAINFVKELEQLLQSMESRKPENTRQKSPARSNPLSGFFTFPQYTTSPITSHDLPTMTERRSGVADIEVNMVDTHANIKILAKRQPKQLLKIVTRFQSLGFTVLHLNVTTVEESVLYSLSVKIEDECQLSTVNEIATAVHEIVGMIQQETTLIREVFQ